MRRTALRRSPRPRTSLTRLIAVIALAGSVLLGACGGSTSPDTTAPDTTEPAPAPDTTAPPPAPTTAVPSRPPTTIHVPADAPTIQAAVDKTVPGDLVLVAPGTYAEAVEVRTPGITVRGTDRSSVILDGGDELENGVLVAADRVAVENLTIRRYTFNGVLFTKAYDDDVDDPTQHTVLQGYAASYLTVSNNGQYGVYAFFARGGRIDHVYVSGHPDSGIYIGQCKPCDAVVSDVTAERNAIGYVGTNGSGNLYVINSVWRNNRVGMTPNSQDMERLAPQGDVVLAGNLVTANNAADAPATAQGAFGVGIAIAGGTRDHALRNRVEGHVSAGIVVTDLNGYQPERNEVRGNVLSKNGVDLVMVAAGGGTSVVGRSNCFAENTFATSLPERIEAALPCTAPVAGAVPVGAYRPVTQPPDVDYRKVPLPPPQPSMPDASTAPATAVDDGVPTVDLAAITVPPAA